MADITATDLIQGPGDLWSAPFGSAEPADTAMGVAADPTTPWVYTGATSDGVEVKVVQKFKTLEVDQVPDVVGRRLTMRDFQMTTNMAQPTLDNLSLTLNGPAAATGTGVKTFEPASSAAASQPTYRALILDGFAPAGMRRRVILRKTLSVEDVEFAYKKDEQTIFKATFAGHYVSASVKPFKIVDGVAA